MYRAKHSSSNTLGETSCRECGLGRSQYDDTSKGEGYAETALWIVNPLAAFQKHLPIIGPIIEKIFSPIKGIIGGMFAKATHMGDCMKWWDNENNIRGMATGIVPILISIEQFYSNMDKAVRQRFDERQAKGDSLGINRMLNTSTRRYKIVNNFVAQVRANPEVMQLTCMSQPNVQRETGDSSITPAYVESIVNQFRQQAQEAEYNQTFAELSKVMDIRNILQITSEQWGRVEAKREAGSLIPSVRTQPGIPLTFPTYTSGGSLIHNVGPAIINKGFPVVPKVK